jgi:hypothetical protein
VAAVRAGKRVEVGERCRRSADLHVVLDVAVRAAGVRPRGAEIALDLHADDVQAMVPERRTERRGPLERGPEITGRSCGHHRLRGVLAAREHDVRGGQAEALGGAAAPRPPPRPRLGRAAQRQMDLQLVDELLLVAPRATR